MLPGPDLTWRASERAGARPHTGSSGADWEICQKRILKEMSRDVRKKNKNMLEDRSEDMSKEMSNNLSEKSVKKECPKKCHKKCRKISLFLLRAPFGQYGPVAALY